MRLHNYIMGVLVFNQNIKEEEMEYGRFSATANTGGGIAWGNVVAGGSGGSGVVVIKYQYQ